MKISSRKKAGLVAVVLVFIIIGVTDIVLGKVGEGIAMMVAALAAVLVSWRNVSQIEKMERQGIDPYDERIMQVAGLAAQGAVKLFALGLAVFIGLGAVVGPVTLVNPYNFAGYLLAIIIALYVGLFTYHNRRL